MIRTSSQLFILCFVLLISAACTTTGLEQSKRISADNPPVVQASDIVRLRLYFGLSLPDGGAVSLADWQDFQNNTIATTFEGFNIVDSVGYYKGKPERSKVMTLILKQADIPKAKALAGLYAKRFKQESVMLVTVPVADWEFVGPSK